MNLARVRIRKYLEECFSNIGIRCTQAPLKQEVRDTTLIIHTPLERRRRVATSPAIYEAELDLSLEVITCRSCDIMAYLDDIADRLIAAIEEDRSLGGLIMGAELGDIEYDFDQSSGNTFSAIRINYKLRYDLMWQSQRRPSTPIKEVSFAY